MTRSVLPLLALVLLVLDAGSAPKLKDPPRVPAIAGEWQVVTLSQINAKYKFLPGHGHRFSFGAGGQVVVKGWEVLSGEWDYKAGDGADPRPIDLPKAAALGPGIYKVEGDILTLYFAPAGGERPTEFVHTFGMKGYLITLVQIKK